MGISDLRKEDDDGTGSKTYVEFQSDASEAQRKAYRLASRGGQMREGVEDIDELYARLTPLLAKHLFEGESVQLMEWLELDEDDWQAYQDSLEDD